MSAGPKRSGRPSRAAGAKAPTARFTDEERAAMRQHAEELRRAARRGPNREAEGEADVLAAIAAMPEPYRAMGQRLHAIIRKAAPTLVPRTWYGMPAYSKDGSVVCFFRGGDKFKERYMTLGFNDNAALDEGAMWPVAYAVTELTDSEAARVETLVRKATR